MTKTLILEANKRKNESESTDRPLAAPRETS